MESILAADLGGTNFRVALIGADEEIVMRRSRPVPVSKRREEVIAVIADLAGECIEQTGTSSRPAAFGLAVPAVVDAKRGTIISAPNLPDLDGYQISKHIAERLDIKVFLENDATAACVGEHWKGVSRGFANIIHMTLGTGVGGGIMIDNLPMRGPDGTAGEIGHICVEPDGVPCGCGSNGCVEQYASASAVVRMAEESGEFGPAGSITADNVYDAGVAGNRAAVRIFETVGRYLGVALGGLINALNPEAIVVGGGLSNGWSLFYPALHRELEYRAFQRPFERVKLLRSALGDDAGLFGAARVAADGL
jgi:glucokinase